MNVLDVKDFSFTYPDRHQVIHNLSFSLAKGEMMLICGKNGCGKSTLLRCIKKEVAPKGKAQGEIRCAGTSQILFQDCDKNIIFRSAYEDLIFPACNSGMPEEEINKKAEEVLALFGITHLKGRNTGTLSGGEKQILSLAALFMLEPDLLLLDEPLAQLDEPAKEVFLQKLALIQSSGTAIIIAEHHTDTVLEKAQKVLIFSDGTNEVFDKKALKDATVLPNFPEYIRLEQRLQLPISDFTAAEACENLRAVKENITICPLQRTVPQEQSVLAGENICFSYGENKVLNSLNFELHKGEIAFLCGANGAGKSTLLELICAFHKPSSGSVHIHDNHRLGYLAQNPVFSFLKDTLLEDYRFVLKKNKLPESVIGDAFARYPLFADLEALLGKNPLDLSGGERAKAAIFKLILLGRDIMLLDEPEKHLDKNSMEALSNMLLKLSKSGFSFLIVSHSPDFIYRTAHAVHHLSDGSITSFTPEQYFPQQCETSLYKAIKPTALPLSDVTEAEVKTHG